MGDLTMKKGMYVLFSAQSLRKNPEFWSEPDKFDPERYWTAEEKVCTHDYIQNCTTQGHLDTLSRIYITMYQTACYTYSIGWFFHAAT